MFMAVRIRLSRIGRKKTPFYSLVAIDSRSKRDGAFLSNIGTYDGLKGTVVNFNEEVYKDWVSKGAIPSDSAKKIYRTYKRSLKKEEAAVATQATVKKAAAPKKTAKAVEAKDAETKE
jgi:small subunit ribosomal protein S16